MYKKDLASIQHQGFSDFAASAAPGVLDILRTEGITAGHVVDLGCGDGAWLRLLNRRGFAGTGIEQSASLARYARATASGSRITVASLHRAVFPQCDAITALGEVLSYVQGEGRAFSLDRVFQRAHRALRPGGVLIFDVLVPGRRMDYNTWRAGPTWAVLAQVYEEPARRRVIRDIVTFRRVRRGYRRAGEHHVLAVSTRGAVLASLRRAGFSARSSRSYGRFALPPRRLAFVARKRR